MSPEEIGYIAGLIDSMARVRVIQSQEGTRLPRIEVSTTNTPLVEYLGRQSGVKHIITRRSYDRHRCGLHCQDAHDHITSVSGRWQISGAKATVILAAVAPQIRLQRGVLEEALEVGLTAPRKMATAQKMYDLGWPAVETWKRGSS